MLRRPFDLVVFGVNNQRWFPNLESLLPARHLQSCVSHITGIGDSAITHEQVR